ncbi:MAG: c-type cytochrome [Campylobacterales bacterium]
MKKGTGLLAALVVAGAMAQGAFASIETGQKLYLKSCKSCHGNGVKGAAMATQAGWDKWFANGAEALIKKHEKTPAANYFNGAGFKAHMPHLHDFLKEYGSDSGNVPACG